jgi:ribonuclease D
MQFAKSISREEMNELPLRAFEGEIHVVEKEDDIREAVAFLSRFDKIGFDTETKPSFKKGRTNKVSLLQLSNSDTAFLFRLNGNGLHVDIANLLENKSIIKIGVAIKDDIIALQKLRKFEAATFVDLQTFVKKLGFQNFSLQKLAALVLGFRISKAKRLSNWESQQLSKAQLKYAATDAWVSLEIYNKLLQVNN